MEQKPLVSVIIPTYKRPNFLDRAINSVLQQTYPNIEIIVVDDNNPGTEGRFLTERIMEGFKESPNVYYIKHEHNKNGSAARNTGAFSSKGSYIAFLDDDDQYLPKKIESQVNMLESLSDDWGFCYNQYYTQRGDEKPVPVNEHRQGDLYLNALMHKGFCINLGSNVLIRRKAFETVHGFDESFKRNQDHEIMVRLLRLYKIAYVSEPGLIYSVGTTNVSIDYEETVDHYVEAFKPYVDELDKKQKKEFDISINNYRFVNYLRAHNYNKALKLLLKGRLPLWKAISTFTRYSFMYVKRRL